MARLRQRRMWSRRTSRGGLYIEPAVSSFESSANRPSSSLYRAQCDTGPIGLSAHVHQMAVGEQLRNFFSAKLKCLLAFLLLIA